MAVEIVIGSEISVLGFRPDQEHREQAPPWPIGQDVLPVSRDFGLRGAGLGVGCGEAFSECPFAEAGQGPPGGGSALGGCDAMLSSAAALIPASRADRLRTSCFDAELGSPGDAISHGGSNRELAFADAGQGPPGDGRSIVAGLGPSGVLAARVASLGDAGHGPSG